MANSKNYGEFEIIGEGSKYGYQIVRFLNTGFEYEFRKDAIQKGEIRDKYAVTLCGVGIIGDIKTRGKNKNKYTVWRNMITRCYDGKNKAYINVSVCDRWKTFEYFVEDMPLIEGWDEEKFESGDLQIDKDIKQRHSKNKIYSIETCVWCSKTTNSRIQDNQQRTFIATAPSGEIYIRDNITQFAREHNLERKQISAVLHKRYHSTFGWYFEYADKEIV